MSTYRNETLAIRSQSERTQQREHSVPLYLTSSFTFENAEHMRAAFSDEVDANIYSRYSNPNVDELLEKIAQLEGGEAAWATATGMAAVFTTFAALLGSGDHIVSSRSVFGSTHNLFVNIFPKWGITTTYVDADDYEAYANAITPATKILYLETPSNPGLDIIDLEKIGAICKEKNVLFVVDNCFATPVLQQPIRFGADIVIHSATKYIDGQGRVLGGLIVSTQELIDKIQAFARHSGPAMSPFNAWILSKSLETLHLRVEKHCQQALEIAKRLENHPAVDWVKYPFLDSHPQVEIARKQMSAGGGIVSFQIKGGLEAGRAFLDKLSLFSLTPNLGDSRSIATHPASTTHSKLKPEERAEVGISDGLVRLSIGLEHIEDIWEDLELAFK
ncbi:MAG: O-succinylhomoserine sulfhydrylase [Candidatus Fluviicola riflensis]|nr:MAG: O-succinylhomoserine sulfhydrylase [Candidatus Fluviicola riflensis]OGS79330.1 MAG: O-succinylhomoserine sulfhydrylase [Candidatus Fluviicola riflensis]OGS86762.1 MAG: O-succinylhomoserine sulfhydrylase [Fluviicola sp. RIFCSPHIGHO2_01_FULL_43_53]OGS88764.1 MAG: O-succinylhomoserine sulfhydrylase [Fluviicola sp. RIFCSPHIGHO2_12_FULL_43_24]